MIHFIAREITQVQGQEEQGCWKGIHRCRLTMILDFRVTARTEREYPQGAYLEHENVLKWICPDQTN